MSSSALTAQAVQSVTDIDASEWDACANPPGASYNPFLRHAYFAALEQSGSATARTGWQPFHITLRAPDERLLGVMPLYVKGHSRGEYVFDHAWADAYERAGGSYYPKLLAAVPFTPATGRRLLVNAPDDDLEARAALEQQLLLAAVQIAEQIEISSLHMIFMPEAQWQGAGKLGLLQRMDQQYHWQNDNYASFDDFLAALNSKKRKNLRRERRDALADGIEVEWLTGAAITEEHWDSFYRFYTDTGSRKWGSPYLTRDFYTRIGRTMPEDVLLILCRRAGRYIAGAINFIGSDTLYGRHWGCIEDHRFLHFEVCYYQAIDFAIQRGLAHVEAGAQGAHKVARGYQPRATYSAHWIRDAGFRDAVARYLEEERSYVRREIDWTEAHLPFRHGDGETSSGA